MGKVKMLRVVLLWVVVFKLGIAPTPSRMYRVCVFCGNWCSYPTPPD